MIKLDIKKELHGSSGKMLLEVNLNINSGEFIALSGVSGSGKTTILRTLAGLE
ncbi:ATP-binding cassette domain-containing protein, partial [Aliarcobacter butzleri]